MLARLRFIRLSARELLSSSRARAVIFDMDGVLADTAELHVEAWNALLDAHGLPPPQGEPAGWLPLIRSTFGQSNDTIIPLLWRHAGRPLDAPLVELSREKEAYYRRAARDRVRPLAGADRFLRWLARRGVPAAVGTSGPEENVRFLLDEFGWHGLFAALVDRSRFAAGKPAPDCFLRAAADLRVPPSRAIVFEDSIHGLLAARRGGFIPAAIASTHEESDLRPHARWVFRDFRELSG
jgi:HAD superfamily hydrolase (TIGR01509 family)